MEMVSAVERWVVRDLLPASGSLNLFGAPKQGKSFLALQLASAIADPDTQDFLGFPVLTHGKVFFLQVDTPRGEWQSRLTSLQTEGKLRFDDVYIADMESVTSFPFEIMGAGGKELRTACNELQPVAVFVDTLREIHGGEENDATYMKHVIAALTVAVRPAALVALSHAKKPQKDSNGDIRSNARGSSYIAGRMDAIAELRNGQIEIVSRTIGSTTIDLEQDPDVGVFRVKDDPLMRKAMELVGLPGVSDRERARMLVSYAKNAITLEKARWTIRHAQARTQARANGYTYAGFTG